MKVMMKKSLAVLMSFVMIVSVLFGLSFASQVTASAADVNTVNYVYDGSYVYNWGERETEATFLSPMAEAFYTGNDVALSELLALSGSSTESGVPSSALYTALHDLMESNHTNPTSYDGTRELYRYTDCENSGSPSTISSFYSGAAIGPDWDGGETWNREHTWPNSKGDLAGNGENDIMMLRPASTSENGSRSNKAYGESTGYFNPNIGSYDLRGDVARIILYQYVRWECTNTGSSYNSTGIFGTDGVIESQDLLLDWLEADPVDTWELGRNDAVEAITGTRNVFVDYPELGFDLFNEAVPTGYTSPSGGADVEGGVGSGSTSDTSMATITFDDTAKRTSFGDSAQVWEENGITFTNNKSSSTTNVADYSNPVRVYKNSEVIISYASPITKIEFATSGTTYATALQSSISSLGDVTVSGNTVTLTLTTPTTTFTYSNTGGATRFNSITIYAEAGSDDSGEGGDNSGDSGDTGDSGDSGDTTQTTEVNASITFDDTGLVGTETTAQIWSENGVTVTNNKGTSTSAFYETITDHTRFYKGNQIVIEYEYPISKIVFTTTGSSYNTNLANSLTSSGLGTVTSSSPTITLELTTPSTTVTFDHVNSATRVKSMDITAQKPADGGDTTSPVITPTTNHDAYGTVELSGKYITATPNDGYEIDSTNPYTILSGTATVTQSGNNFTVEADADVTVQINFVARTQYTVTFSDLGTTSTATAYSGDTVTLPTLSSGDYTAVGWVAATIDGETTDKPTVYNAGATYTVTANVTLYALYSRTQAGGSGESDVFAEYTGTITEGDYLIVYDGGAMKASVTSSRLDYTEVTVSGNSITSPDASLIWTVTADGDYYTLYNESTGKYAAGTGAKNKAQLLSAVEDKARWTVSGTATYEFVNKANAAASVNANLRKNGTYGFACYATGTGGALTLYKRTAAAMTTYYFTSAGETPDYTVTVNANDDTFGTVSVSGTTISATPNEGYTVAGYSIASGTATVTQEGTTFFVTPTSNVVITVNFEALPTYTVTFVENGTEVGTESTYSGGFIKLPEYSGELDEYTTFDGWAEQENETDSTKIYAAKATYAVTKNVTLYAQFTVTEPPVVEGDHYFIKVTEDQTDWTGTYLIVYEAGSIAFNGAMANKLDAVSNGVGVTMADGKIAANDANIAVSFVVEKIEGGYTIRSKSGLYFGSESDTNSLLSNATKTYFNNFAVDADGNIVITGEGGAILRYNATSGQDRFRFYKTSSYASQQPIALYKLDVADITGAQVTIGSDLTMKYYVDVTNIENVADGDLTMRFSIDGEVIDTVTGTVVGSQYVFDFAGLAPQRMADAIKAEVLYKGTLIDVKDNYSIKTNAQNLLTENAGNAELCQFITDMLYYGAAAQKYTKYNTANLATDGVTGLGTPSTATPTEADKMSLVTEDGVPSGSPYFRAATVWFDSENGIIVKVEGATSNTWIEVDGEIVEIVDGQYKLDNIKVTDFDNVYTFELYEDGYLIQTLQYSINAYAYSKQNSTNANMAELALALFRLGQSAEKL
ncbi:MAG: endonuclease [Clostridia bacterium]|nr:endonuclease [Clostridia bacterium]